MPYKLVAVIIKVDKEEVKEIATPIPSLITRRKRIKELLGKLVDLLVV